MYYYRSPHFVHDKRFIGFGLPFVGAFLGGLLGSALITRPFYGYPFYGYPCGGYPCYQGFPSYGYPGSGYPPFGYPNF